MLKKTQYPEISVENPWANDKLLLREHEAKKLTELIKTITGPFVISVNSRWGTGKTCFLKMWKAQFEQDGQPCMYYNAWDNDYSCDPFVSFVDSFYDFSKNIMAEKSGEAGSKISSLMENAKRISRKAAPYLVKIVTRGTIENMEELLEVVSPVSPEDVSSFAQECFVDEIKRHGDIKRSSGQFIEVFSSVVSDILSKTQTGQFVVFVDELDRCKPDFAIQFLERIKHIFSVDRVVFVLAIDKQQLVNSIRHFYGAEIDACDYLKRFIDVDYSLRSPEIYRYFNHLWEQFRIDDCIAGLREYESIQGTVGDVLYMVHQKDNISLRDMDQFMTKFNVIIRTWDRNRYVFDSVVSFFLIISITNNKMYEEIRNKTADIGSIRTYFDVMDKERDYSDWISATVLYSYAKEVMSHSKLCQFIDGIVNNDSERERYRNFLSNIHSREASVFRASFRVCVECVEGMRNFS